MIFALLRRGDGLASGRIWLSSAVKHFQTALASAGHAISTDGKFGTGTENAVKAFQSSQGLNETGVADRATWDALAGHLRATVGALQEAIKKLLNGFEGDLDWVHEREGHRGTAYWPGGNSGVTLDPGVDLGHVDWTEAQNFYASLLTAQQKTAVTRVLGLKGEPAKSALDSDPLLQGIRINSVDAERIMPFAARPYWNGIVDRFSSLVNAETLPSVQTVFLSLAYNRGSRNPDLEQLRNPLESRNWSEVARRIGAMQQDHELEGIRVRRRMEADLVRAELEFMSS